jgi:predicted transcriptional regulator
VDANRDRLHDLLRLLAFQIGSEVSLNELAAATRMDVKAVDRYLCLLESAYVIRHPATRRVQPQPSQGGLQVPQGLFSRPWYPQRTDRRLSPAAPAR